MAAELSPLPSPPPPNPWPTLLRLLRRRLNISLERLANLVEVHPKSLTAWEAATIVPPAYVQTKLLALESQAQHVDAHPTAFQRPGLALVTVWSPTQAGRGSRCIAEGIVFADGQVALRFGLPATHLALFSHTGAVLSAYPGATLQERIL